MRDLGRRDYVNNLPEALIDAAVTKIHSILEDGVDRIKTSARPLPLILVGGGAILVNRDISGASEVIIPEHAGVANAIGASIAQVGGEVDKVYSYEQMGRDAAIVDAKQQAVLAAVEAGALEDSVEMIDFEEVPLSYIPGNAVRLRVKTAGELAVC